MNLIGESTIYKHPRAATLYISIPAHLARDSQFKMKNGDKVKLVYKIDEKELTIKKEVKS